jgi:hypothetical protein
MSDIIRLQDLQAEEITRLLENKGHRLSEDRAAARRCADRINGLKSAFDIFEDLPGLDKAA